MIRQRFDIAMTVLLDRRECARRAPQLFDFQLRAINGSLKSSAPYYYDPQNPKDLQKPVRENAKETKSHKRLSARRTIHGT
jgi:hypothetical protein